MSDSHVGMTDEQIDDAAELVTLLAFIVLIIYSMTVAFLP